MNRYRTREIARLAGSAKSTRRSRVRKLNRNTDPYVHLNSEELEKAVLEVARTVSNCGFARLFAECSDKTRFNQGRSPRTVGEQAFEQVVSRFERFLQNMSSSGTRRNHGLPVHDKNLTVARKHTAMMRSFHATGTLWTSIHRIIETPMFGDSELTRVVLIADLCAYVLRRFPENGETGLSQPIFGRADRVGENVARVRHSSQQGCDCVISVARTPESTAAAAVRSRTAEFAAQSMSYTYPNQEIGFSESRGPLNDPRQSH